MSPLLNQILANIDRTSETHRFAAMAAAPSITKLEALVESIKAAGLGAHALATFKSTGSVVLCATVHASLAELDQARSNITPPLLRREPLGECTSDLIFDGMEGITVVLFHEHRDPVAEAAQ